MGWWQWTSVRGRERRMRERWQCDPTVVKKEGGVLPCADPECWWGTWRCMSETGWLLTWWTCRVKPPAERDSQTVKNTTLHLFVCFCFYLIERWLLQPTPPLQEWWWLPGARKQRPPFLLILLLLILSSTPLCRPQVEKDREDSTNTQHNQGQILWSNTGQVQYELFSMPCTSHQAVSGKYQTGD